MKNGEVSIIERDNYQIRITWMLSFVKFIIFGSSKYSVKLIYFYPINNVSFNTYTNNIFNLIIRIANRKTNIKEWENIPDGDIIFDINLFLNGILEGGICL